MKATWCACLVLLSWFSPALRGQAPDDSSSDRYVIDAAKLVRDGGARTLTDILISQVPGLLVVPGSGLTGGGARIRFAGARSLIADAPPLILVDGMRIDAQEDATLLALGGPGPSRLDDLPAEEIESVEVLPGIASAAVYGPGAAGGVILVRTKRGTAGPVRLETYAQGTMRARPSRWPTNYGGVDLDNADLRMQQGWCSLSAQAAGYCVQDFVQTFNPLVERNPFATALRRQVGFSGSGGPRWGAFRLGGALDGDAAAYSVPAVASDDDYRRWNAHASGAIYPVSGLEIAARVTRISSDLRLPLYGPIQAALIGPSDSAGFSWAPWFRSSGTQAVDRTRGVVHARARLASWLTLEGQVGLEDVDQREGSVVPGVSRFSGRRDADHRSVAFRASTAGLKWRGMRFTTTAGVEWLTNRHRDVQLSAVDPDSEFAGGVSPQESFVRLHSIGDYVTEQVAVGERLFITGALRHDSYDRYRKLGGRHPSLALAWVARPETSGSLGRLTLRAAYGSASQPPPSGLEFLFVPVVPGSASPPPIRPERTRSFELGADAALLDGRWQAQGTVYDLRSDVINTVYFHTPFGLVFTYANGAAISNRGVAVTLSGSVLDRATFGWDVRLSLWGNRNRLVKLVGTPFDGFEGSWFVQHNVPGYPVGGYRSPPILSYADANRDGIIVLSEVDMGSYAWAGTPYPTQGAAMTSSWRVAGRWRIAATLDYRAGQTLFNETAYTRCLYGLCREKNDPATPLADQARAAATSYAPPLAYFEDADYLKVREVWIAYDLPPTTAAVLGARAATITLAGRDLLTWTDYSGGDPESGSYGTVLASGARSIGDYATVPVPRSVALRVRLSY